MIVMRTRDSCWRERVDKDGDSSPRRITCEYVPASPSFTKFMFHFSMILPMLDTFDNYLSRANGISPYTPKIHW